MTKGRLNEVSFWQNLDSKAKNVIRHENPLELVVKDVSKFDTQNTVIGSLIWEIDIGKKDVLNKLLAKAPNLKDIDIRSRLDSLRNSRNNFDDGDESPLPPPLNFLPPLLPPWFSRNLPPLLPPPPFNYLDFQGFFPPSLPQFRPLNVKNSTRSVKQTLSDDRLIGELERVIEKIVKKIKSKLCLPTRLLTS